jgi:phenylalanyl-tRNA synthetase alpha chain
MKILYNSISRFSTAKERSYQTSQTVLGLPPYYDPRESNLTSRIWSLTKRKLYKQRNHPICILKNRTKNYFDGKVKSYAVFPIRPNESFTFLEDLSFIVSTKQCFDDLNVPVNHISRSKSDTYYINKSTVLRTQTSAHQVETIKAGYNSFLVFGKVIEDVR